MSAIFGLIHLDGEPVGEPELERMGAALAPYGPDAEGILASGHAGLGHRLMRFTPEDCYERQPLVSHDKRRLLVSDARIDNRPELIAELGISAPVANQLPDSALILSAYEKWGDDCAARLVGAFAFALYDIPERRLFLARSPMGERSLFYYETSRTFAFASAPKGLFALPFVPRKVDPQSVIDYLLFLASEPGTSCFSGISRLKAGHSIVVVSGKSRSRQFRGIEIRPIRFRRDSDYVEAFNALLDRVTADMLRSSTPVGIWLSGGLDSTTIAAAAARKLRTEGKRLNTFTAVPPSSFHGATLNGWYADETPFVLAMARMYENLDPHFIQPDARFFLDDVAQVLAVSETPPLGATHLNWVRPLQQEARRQNARVLLTGTPGNFTISYDGQSLVSQRVRQGRWLQAIRLARNFALPPDARTTLARMIGLGLMPLLPAPVWMAVKDLQARRIPGSGFRAYPGAFALNPELGHSKEVNQRARRMFDLFRAGVGPASRATLLLWLGDRISDTRRGEEALNGVQNRDLPAEFRMVEFCLSIPGDQFLNAEESRWLIRRAGEERLPREVRENRMRGLQSPNWLESLIAGRARLFEEVDALQKSPLAAAMLDVPRLRRLIEQIPASQDGSWRLFKDYRGGFEFGMTAGRFLRWVESGA